MRDIKPIEITDSTVLCSLPIQLIEIDNGALIVRGCSEIKVIGDRALDAVKRVWTTALEKGATKDEIRQQFAEPDRETVDKLIAKFIDKRILVPQDTIDEPTQETESSLEIFYWHFNSTDKKITDILNAQTIVIIGVNSISKQLASSLDNAGVSNINVIDYKLARNQRMFENNILKPTDWPSNISQPKDYKEWMDQHDPSETKCIIVTSDFANTKIMKEWNQFCLDNSIHFFPIMLRKMVGHVGPFVVPGETACYQCLMSRENSHLEDASQRRTSEEASFFRQAVTGFFPSMGSILGDIASLELVKFYSGIMRYNVGHLVEISLLVPSLISRKVLRAPRCTACSNVIDSTSNSLEKADFMPGSQFVEGDNTTETGQYSPQERFGPNKT